MKVNKKIAKLWYNGEIPARLFFDILDTQELKGLKKTKGYAKQSELKSNWAKIYDEFFILKDDPKLAVIITTQVSIIQMIRSIEITRQAIYAICTVQFEDDQLKELGEKITEQGFNFDFKEPLESALRILKEDIPSIETRIEIEKDNLKELTSAQVSTFEENCVGFEGWGYSVDENCSLRRYVAYEKAVKKKASKQKTNGRR